MSSLGGRGVPRSGVGVGSSPPVGCSVGSPSLVAADDAIRSQSVHSVAGSGLALGLVALAAVGAYLAQSQVLVLRRFLTVPTLLLPVLAIAVCLFYGHRRWRVTRFDRRAEAATTC